MRTDSFLFRHTLITIIQREFFAETTKSNTNSYFFYFTPNLNLSVTLIQSIHLLKKEHQFENPLSNLRHDIWE